MRSQLLVKAAAAACLFLPLAASADVTYSYTGNLFNDVSVIWRLGDEPPDISAARAAAAAAALKLDNISIDFTLPTYMPAGWSSFSSTGSITGALGTALGNSGISWRVNNRLFGDSGYIPVSFDSGSFDWDFATRISVSVHVDSNHRIDAWELSMEPGALLHDFGDKALSVSSSNGDQLLYAVTNRFEYQIQQAANTAAGSWSVSGVPVSAVPEPGGAALLLAGLGTLGALRRRKA